MAAFFVCEVGNTKSVRTYSITVYFSRKSGIRIFIYIYNICILYI